jgi:hypothetical protein
MRSGSTKSASQGVELAELNDKRAGRQFAASAPGTKKMHRGYKNDSDHGACHPVPDSWEAD